MDQGTGVPLHDDVRVFRNRMLDTYSVFYILWFVCFTFIIYVNT